MLSGYSGMNDSELLYDKCQVFSVCEVPTLEKDQTLNFTQFIFDQFQVHSVNKVVS